MSLLLPSDVRLIYSEAELSLLHRCQTDKEARDSKIPFSLAAAAFSSCHNGRPSSDALHKSHGLPGCLPAGVVERSETVVSVPTSCLLFLTLPLFISIVRLVTRSAEANFTSPQLEIHLGVVTDVLYFSSQSSEESAGSNK